MYKLLEKLNMPHTLRYPTSLLERTSRFPTLLVICVFLIICSFCCCFGRENSSQKIIMSFFSRVYKLFSAKTIYTIASIFVQNIPEDLRNIHTINPTYKWKTKSVIN